MACCALMATLFGLLLTLAAKLGGRRRPPGGAQGWRLNHERDHDDV